jgi:hypothetical protein
MKQIVLAETFRFGSSVRGIARWFEPFEIKFTEGPDHPIDAVLRADLAMHYGEVREFCKVFDLPASEEFCIVILRLLEDEATSKGRWLHVPTSALTKSIEAELKSKKCLLLRPDRVRYFEAKNLFGERVANRFPLTILDIEEAGKCFSMERFTACVLHLMRVLEIGLRALATALNVPFEDREMQHVLNALQQEWKRRERLKRKPQHWKRDRQFYSEAFLEFGYLKDAWRIYAMHGREHYDEERATSILSHVTAFIRHLATRLKE